MSIAAPVGVGAARAGCARGGQQAGGKALSDGRHRRFRPGNAQPCLTRTAKGAQAHENQPTQRKGLDEERYGKLTKRFGCCIVISTLFAIRGGTAARPASGRRQRIFVIARDTAGRPRQPGGRQHGNGSSSAGIACFRIFRHGGSSRHTGNQFIRSHFNRKPDYRPAPRAQAAGAGTADARQQLRLRPPRVRRRRRSTRIADVRGGSAGLPEKRAAHLFTAHTA